MLQEISLPKNRTQCQWTDEDVFKMLCALNDNIEKIRDTFQEQKRGRVILAADLISEAVGDHCSASSVVRQIRVIWRNCGSKSARTLASPGSMYSFGACARTLPLLDTFYPGMLEKIALWTRVTQSAKFLVNDQRLRAIKLKYEDDGEEDIDAHPIECTCGFAHYASSCVHCGKCASWQHIWCYYKDDDTSTPPDDHTCWRCARPCEFTHIARGFERIDLRRGGMGSLAQEPHTQPLVDVLDFYPGTIKHKLELSDKIYNHGIGDGKVNFRMASITSGIRTISHSVDTKDFEFCTHPCPVFVEHDSPYKVGLSSNDRFLSMRAEIGSALWTWSFDSSLVLRSIGGLSEALLEEYRDILMAPNIRTLADIHQEASTRLLEDRSDILEPSIRREADNLARNILCLLSTVIRRSKSSRDHRPLQTAEDWIRYTDSGVARFDAFVELFRQCIWLKHMLRLSDHCYELYFPAGLEAKFMSADVEDQDRQIKYCFAPAILEYAPQVFNEVKTGGSLLHGRENIVNATPEQRKEGRVVCLAVGMFY